MNKQTKDKWMRERKKSEKKEEEKSPKKDIAIKI